MKIQMRKQLFHKSNFILLKLTQIEKCRVKVENSRVAAPEHVPIPHNVRCQSTNDKKLEWYSVMIHVSVSPADMCITVISNC